MQNRGYPEYYEKNTDVQSEEIANRYENIPKSQYSSRSNQEIAGHQHETYDRGRIEDRFYPESKFPIHQQSGESFQFGVKIKNLPLKAKEWFIKNFFQNFGSIRKIKIISNDSSEIIRKNSCSMNSCHVYFFDDEAVERAVFNSGIRMLNEEITITDLDSEGGEKKTEETSGFHPYGRENFEKKRSGQYLPNEIPQFRIPSSYEHDYPKRGGGKIIWSENDPQSWEKVQRDSEESYRMNFKGAYEAEDYPKDGNGLVAPKPKKPRKPYKKVLSSPIVYIGNLNYKTNNKQIMDLFSPFGFIVDLRVAYNSSGSVSSFF